MIFGNIKTWDEEKHIYSNTIQKAMSYLQENDFTTFEPGKYEIDGKNIFASVIDTETEPKENRAPEAHIKYVDIQYLVSGKESMGFAKLSDNLTVKEDKLEEKDVIKYTNDVPNEVDIKLVPGDFAIFFPSDVHRPLCAFDGVQSIRKVVVKIAVSAL